MNKAVIFGAGNIGRSFIGSIFAGGGYEVTFVDANRALVDELNRRRGYTILIKRNDRPDEKLNIGGIKALHSADEQAVLDVLAECSLCSTSVGQSALKFVAPQIAKAVIRRREENLPLLDIIIAENIRNGADHFRNIFRDSGLKGDEAGLVETSIGKMVPIMTEKDLADDPLVLHAEEYNTLILDGRGFKNTPPELPEIKTVNNIAAWVDRKLFIHNLGHAATAYFGFQTHPGRRLIADVINDDNIRLKVRSAMQQSAAALLSEYPEDFTEEALQEHIDDLIFRFGNKALGDTVFRVGRDLYRKLGRDDRILGAAALCIKYSLPCNAVIDVFKAATEFRATDEHGAMLEKDSAFHEALKSGGLPDIIENRLGLAAEDVQLKKLLTASG